MNNVGWVIPTTNDDLTAPAPTPVNNVGWVIPTTNDDLTAEDPGESVGWPIPTTNDDQQKSFEPNGRDVKIHKVLEDGQGGGYLLASFSGSLEIGGWRFEGMGGRDLFIARFADQTWVWGAVLGGSGDESDPVIALDAHGDLFVAAAFANRIRVGSQTMVSLGYRDLFVAKLDQNGSPFWIKQLGGMGEDHLEAVRPTEEGGISLRGASSFQDAFDVAAGLAQVTHKSFAVEYSESGTLVSLEMR